MKRRSFLKTCTTALFSSSTALASPTFFKDFSKDFLKKTTSVFEEDINSDIEPHVEILQNRPDIIFTQKKYKILKDTLCRITRVRNTVGYGNFNLVHFDDMLRITKEYPKIGRFTKEELNLIEELFFFDATEYGFYGQKVVSNLTYKVPRKEVIKLPHTGHFLFKGSSLSFYNKVRKDVGYNIILTSGIRGIPKQIHLFLQKAISESGNLSVASRSLAPPGYSFHGIGDFDVGKVGYGYRNFTDDFAETDIFKKLTDLGYVKIRYPQGNPFGVRFEPWHIKVDGT